jgi:ATP-dependent DNA helicase RecQ
VYAHSRAAVERIAERLRRDGVDAAAYHAGMEPEARARTQEAFKRDEVRVICATVAFGMGIHKPNVRFVVHHDLPRDIESYYQETGRAGRDGLPGECLLLFNAADAVKQARFIADKADPDERGRSRKKLSEMVSFAESGDCRRAALLAYFGEKREEGPCGSCDNCLSPRERYDGTVAAQKLLSCVLRIQQRSRLSTGLHHVASVLVGADNEKIRRWGHDSLSTYGIGKELSRPEWLAVGRELLRLGLLRLSEERLSVLQVTPAGREALAKRSRVMLTRPSAPAAKTAKALPFAAPAGVPATAALPCDEVLLETLRRLRRQLADQRNVPAYVIFSDVSLRQMAREYPVDVGAFHRIHGVGEKKLQDLGATFMLAIGEHVKTHGKKQWDEMDEPEEGSAAETVGPGDSGLGLSGAAA